MATRLRLRRAVHPYERAEMMTVWRTNQDAADFACNMALAVPPSFFSLPIVFLAAGAISAGVAQRGARQTHADARGDRSHCSFAAPGLGKEAPQSERAAGTT